MNIERRRIGKTDIEVTPIGLGCWQFSEGKGFHGFVWSSIETKIIEDIVKTTLDKGINWFDTAEIYGKGRSEIALARSLKKAGKNNGDVVIATKWWPIFRTAKSILKTIDKRIKALDGFSIDLYQVHQPFSLSSHEAEMDAMAELVSQKKIRAVGVSNFSAERMIRAYKALEKYGIPLASNQVKYNILDRKIETNGILDRAKELGITIIAYSPLEMGLLSGKFHKDPLMLKKVPLLRRRFLKRKIEQSRLVIETLEEIAKNYNATPSQVALNWVINFHGNLVIAIPGASKVSQAEQNADALRFKLTDQEMEKIDIISRQFR